MGASLAERESEFALIAESLTRASAGEGSVLLLEGEAGIGKTALLTAAAEQAQQRGLHTLWGRASELEREFPYGVVRQMLLRALAALPPPLRAEVTSGAAELAAPVLWQSDHDEPPEQGAVLHGLYWLVVELAARRPLLLLLDDAQWCDAASLRFAAFLARRIEGTPVLLAIGHRDTERRPAALAQIAQEPLSTTIRPRALTQAGIGRLVAEKLGTEAEPSFLAAFQHATGGVPFLVNELLDALAAGGAGPTAASVGRLRSTGPRTVAKSTTLRLAQLGDGAATAARVVAVLGEQSSVERVAAIGGLSTAQAAAALDALVAGHLLEPDSQPPRFRHPLVQSSVYEDIPAFDRQAMHAQAAELMAAAGADPETVAAHLMLVEPRADPEEVELLSAAAQRAMARGAPESAVSYLRRAVAAPAQATNPHLQFQLGRCEQLARDPACVDTLRGALAATVDPAQRAPVAMALAESLFYALDLIGGWTVLQTAAAELGPEHEDLRTLLLTAAVYVGSGDPRLHRQSLTELVGLGERSADQPAARREIAALLGLHASTGAVPSDQATALLAQALDDGRLLASASADALAITVTVNALVFLDQLDEAEAVTEAMMADAGRRGLVLGFIAASAHRGLAALRRGRLADAEADTRAALELAGQHQLHFTIPFTLTYLSLALLERGAAAEALEMVRALPPVPGFELTLAGAMLAVARGRLQLAVGERDAAVATLRAAGAALDALSVLNPNCIAWRSTLALALSQDDPAEAHRLLAEELAGARRFGSPRAIGIALRAAGLLAERDAGIELLRESVAALATSADRLEHARALVDLGAALRRDGQRAAAREPLRRGLALAAELGATPLRQQAETELRASGARPRRLMLTGRDALTPSEQRIAALAAHGRTNREIAQALFVTPKTVENHLGRIYRKLGITTRIQLATALGAEHEPSGDEQS